MNENIYLRFCVFALYFKGIYNLVFDIEEIIF
jgi:hypothetical protein